jgi:hypothetical protein
LCLWPILIGGIRTCQLLSCCMLILRWTQTLINTGWCDGCIGSLSLIIPDLLGSLKTGVKVGVCIVRIQNAIWIVLRTLIESMESWLIK